MGIQDLVSIGVIGVLLTGIIQFIKNKFGTASSTSKFLVVGLSIVIGAIYYLFRDTQIFLTMLGILTTSSTVYALLLK